MKDANGIALKVGDRVAILPHHYLFLAGAHYGTVSKIGRTKCHVTAHVNDVTYPVNPAALSVVLMAPWLGVEVTA